MDHLLVPGIPSLPCETRTEFIATCRPLREGGCYAGSETTRLKLLLEAAQRGFKWVDVEHDVEVLPKFPKSTRLIRSYHSFDTFPGDLNSLFAKLHALQGDVVKIAVMVSSTRELVTLLSWMESMPPEIRYVLLGMGVFGQASRTLGSFLGNAWTFVAEQDDEGTAPGQFGLKTAVELYRLDGWKEKTKVFAVLGNPVGHSKSPLIHNWLFRQHGLSHHVYLPIQLDELAPWFHYVSSSRIDFKGFSVTLPFKMDAARVVSHRNPNVFSINTLIKKDQCWKGLNTDYHGFLKPLLSRTSVRGKKVLVLGNGGVAHTVVKALIDQGAEVIVLGRDPDRIEQFACQYSCTHGLFSDLPISAFLCVNTTPVGQYPSVDTSLLGNVDLNFEWVYDLVYQPEETKLLKDASSKGIASISGIEMFVEQAALQFSAWTGLEPDRKEMLRLIRDNLWGQVGVP